MNRKIGDPELPQRRRILGNKINLARSCMLYRANRYDDYREFDDVTRQIDEHVIQPNPFTESEMLRQEEEALAASTPGTEYWLP